MKSRVRSKMLMVLQCGGTAEENLSTVDQKIYDMYPHNSNYDRSEELDVEVPADSEWPSVSKKPRKDSSREFPLKNQELSIEMAVNHSKQQSLDEDNSCEVSF